MQIEIAEDGMHQGAEARAGGPFAGYGNVFYMDGAAGRRLITALGW